MKTCIKYWGGKQQLVPKLLKLIPPHRVYNEPFFGGGALFFAKPSSSVESINDINDNMVNFYKQVKRDFPKLVDEIEVTLFSEWQHKQAKELWLNGADKNKIERAWAVFVLSHQSFSGMLGESWAYSRSRNQAEYFKRVKRNFDENYTKRLERTQIFCRDAIDVITAMDSPDTFHFIDPPYINTDCAHYEGYTVDDFNRLLNTVSSIKGKFLLTTFPTDILATQTAKNGWITIKNEMHKSAGGLGATKTEVFTMNYEQQEKQLSIFTNETTTGAEAF